MEHIICDSGFHTINFEQSICFSVLENHGFKKCFQEYTIYKKSLTKDEHICKIDELYLIRKLVKKEKYGSFEYTCHLDNVCHKYEYDKRSPLGENRYDLKRIIYRHPSHHYKFVIENDIPKMEFKSIKNFEQIFYNIYNMFDYVKQEYKELTRYDGFAGTMPTTFEPRYNQKHSLNFKGFSVTAKADGLRFNVFIDKHGKFHLVDRQMKTKTIPGLCNPKLANTIFDCEKVGDKYYGFDLMYYCGKSYEEKSLDKRLVILEKLVGEIGLNFSVKKFYFKFKKGVYIYPGNIKTDFDNIYDVIKHVWEEDQEFPVDGLIFTNIRAPFYNNYTYKWKPNHTIDFMIKKIGSKTQLFSMTDKEFVPFDQRCKLTKHHDGIVDYVGFGDGIGEFDCIWEDGKLRLEFVRMREEKEWPNSLSTISNIFSAVRRNVNIEWFMKRKSLLKVNEQAQKTSSVWGRN